MNAGIQGNAEGLSSAAGGMRSAAGGLGAVSSGIGDAFAPLSSWNGLGESGAKSFVETAQTHLQKAQTALEEVHIAITSYASQVDLAHTGWKRSDTEEQQFKVEKDKLEQELARCRVDLTSKQTELAHIVATNAAAETAYSSAKAAATIAPGLPGITNVVSPPVLHPTGQLQAQIDSINQRISHIQQQISELDQKIHVRETWKKDYEQRAKAASADVTAKVNAAEQMWPSVGATKPGWLNSCYVGYIPPKPEAHHKGGGFLHTAGEIAAGVGVGAAVIGVQFIPGVDVAVDASLAAGAGLAASGAAAAAPMVDRASEVASKAPAPVTTAAAGTATGFVFSTGQQLMTQGHVHWDDSAVNGLGFGVGSLIPGGMAFKYAVGNMTGDVTQSRYDGRGITVQSLAIDAGTGLVGGTAEKYLLPHGYTGFAKHSITRGPGSALRYHFAHASIGVVAKYAKP